MSESKNNKVQRNMEKDIKKNLLVGIIVCRGRKACHDTCIPKFNRGIKNALYYMLPIYSINTCKLTNFVSHIRRFPLKSSYHGGF